MKKLKTSRKFVVVYNFLVKKNFYFPISLRLDFKKMMNIIMLTSSLRRQSRKPKLFELVSLPDYVLNVKWTKKKLSKTVESEFLYLKFSGLLNLVCTSLSYSNPLRLDDNLIKISQRFWNHSFTILILNVVLTRFTREALLCLDYNFFLLKSTQMGKKYILK